MAGLKIPGLHKHYGNVHAACCSGAPENYRAASANASPRAAARRVIEQQGSPFGVFEKSATRFIAAILGIRPQHVTRAGKSAMLGHTQPAVTVDLTVS